MKGMGQGTRSGLYYNGLEILKAKKPAYSIIENVKNLTCKPFKNVFGNILNDLQQAEYNNYYKILNAKDYGVPQNRERIFIVSIRKDIKQDFIFPDKQQLTLKLKDVLEDEVDVKYYLSDEHIKKFIISTQYSKFPMGQGNCI